MKSLHLFTELKAVIGRNFLSCQMPISFQPINRIYFYLHIQVFFRHTFLTTEIVRLIGGNLSFSVLLGKDSEHFYYIEFFCQFFMCWSGLVDRVGYSWASGRRFISCLFHIFIWKTGHRNISVQKLFGTENVQDNGWKKKPKCFGQLPSGTGSQRHMAEKF